MNHIFPRIIFDIILFIGVFILPWWLWFILVVASIFLINFQYEVILFGFVADSVFGGGIVGKNFHFMFLGFVMFVLLLSLFLKPRLKFYENSSR